MSQSGYTPIQLYRTTTAAATPTAGNLAAGELAINLTDEKLYFKNAGGTVKLLASSAGAEGTVTSVAASGGTTGLTFSGSPITSSGTLTLGGTLGVANGGTGASTFTANGVLYGNGASALQVTAAGTTGQVLVGNTGSAPTWATLTSTAVTSISFGTTGLTPSTATQGAVTVAGTLGVANGGTGTATAFTAGSVVFAGASGVYSQDNANLFWDNTNDRLGIGTSSPSPNGRLSVNGNIVLGPLTRNQAATQSVGVWSTGDPIDDNRANIGFTTVAGGASSSSYITFATNNYGVSGGERMRIDSSGNVGIGTSSPNERLRVVGSSGTPQFGAGTAGNAVFVNAFDSNPIYMTASASNSTSFGFGAASNIPLFFMTNNVERMRVTSAGNVGIGTSAPGAKLQINVQDGFRFDVEAGAASTMRFGSALTGEATGAMAFTRTTGAITFSAGSTGSALSELVRITGTGNVGIGTSVPDVKVSIQDAGAGQITLKDSGGTTRAYIMTNGAIGTAPTNSLRIRGDSGVALGAVGSLAMFIDTSNNVGVGTSSPGYKLDVRGGTSSFEGSSGIGAVRIAGAGGSWFWIDNPSTTILRFSSGASAGTNPMTFTDGGSLGIGTSSPGQTLQVVNAGNYQFRLGAGSTFNYDIGRRTSDGFLYFYGNQSGFTGYVFSGADGERMRIDSSGSVVIGATSAAGARFNVTTAGAEDVIYVDANTAGAAGTAVYVLPIRTAATFRGGVRWNGTSVEYNTTSDIRLKENITDADDASALIDAIQVRKFDWKETGFHQRYGFVAQELVEVAPEAVSASSDPEEMMGVDYSKLVPMLVKEIQSLRARVAQLEGN